MGAGGPHQREGERGAAGSGDGEGTGETLDLGTAVLTLRGHGEFLSGAYEVSCRVRTGDVRPCAGTRLYPEPFREPEQAVYLWVPRSCRARVGVRTPDGGRIRRPSGLVWNVSDPDAAKQAVVPRNGHFP
ncbi:hypothetical protein GCM10010335_07600 [Streptomyces galbus]|nr:hypothetical protein GCM10010335_07600 [Streptomyces galbus]